MSSLLLLRHGQASFGAEDYDVLSPLGIRQVEALGSYLAERGTTLDAIYCGPAQRQRSSAEHLCQAASAGGLPVPRVSVLNELDEFPAFELFRQALPSLRERVPEADKFLATGPSLAAANRAFRSLTEAWARGEVDSGELESFEAFEARVARGLDRILAEQGRGKVVAAMTSGGPISLAMRRALALDPTRTLRCAWVLANASISEFRFSDSELGLVSFNGIPHLRDSSLVTYR